MRVPSTTSRPQLCQLEYIYVGCFLSFGTYIKTFKPFSGREITDLDRIPSPTYHPQWSNVTSDFLFLIFTQISHYAFQIYHQKVAYDPPDLSINDKTFGESFDFK